MGIDSRFEVGFAERLASRNGLVCLACLSKAESFSDSWEGEDWTSFVDLVRGLLRCFSTIVNHSDLVFHGSAFLPSRACLSLTCPTKAAFQCYGRMAPPSFLRRSRVSIPSSFRQSYASFWHLIRTLPHLTPSFLSRLSGQARFRCCLFQNVDAVSRPPLIHNLPISERRCYLYITPVLSLPPKFENLKTSKP